MSPVGVLHELAADAQGVLAVERDPAVRAWCARELVRAARLHAEDLAGPEAAALRAVLRTVEAALG